MLGALEIKAVLRAIRNRSDRWGPTHAAVIACLLAYRKRAGSPSWPPQGVIAAFANVSERTVQRISAELAEWGLVGRLQPRALSSGQMRNAQYTFLFPLAPGSPDDKNGPAGRQNPGSPDDTAVSAGYKEGSLLDLSHLDLSGKDRENDRQNPQPPLFQKSEEPVPAPNPPVSHQPVPNHEPDHLAQAATRLMEMVGVPIVPKNREAVEAGILAEVIFSGRSIEETARAIAEAALNDQRNGIAINKFYFEDAKWRQENQPNGRKGNQSQRVVDAVREAKANVARRYADVDH